MYSTLKWITLLNPVANPGDISVNVTDGTDALSGVTVVLTDSDEDTTTKTTDSDGETTFDNVDPGTYTLTASKSGYTTETETIVVNGDATVEMELTVTRSVSFTIDDGDTPTPAAVQGAYITIDGDTAGKRGPTGSGGGCTATLADGEHTLLITAEGFEDKTTTIEVDSTHTSFTISLTAATTEGSG